MTLSVLVHVYRDLPRVDIEKGNSRSQGMYTLNFSNYCQIAYQWAIAGYR